MSLWRSRSRSMARPASACSKLAEDATAKNLKVGVGLMSRHAGPLQELLTSDPERRDRRYHSDARLPHARPGRIFPLTAQTGRYHRPGLPGEALPQLPLGQRRLLQRLLYPPHRPSRLDEERMAGQGAGGGRPPLQGQSRRHSPSWIRTSMSIRWNTPSRMAASSSSTGAA